MIKKYNNISPKIGKGVFIEESSHVIGDVTIKDNASVWHNVVIRGDIEPITIGERSNVQECSVLHCNHGMPLVVGDDVTIGHGAILHSCIIGDGSLIGMGAIILDGAKIGKNCLIGAGATVTPNTIIADGSLAVGSPAQVKKELSQAAIESIYKNSSEYVDLAQEYIKNS
jgi:carbonic anhydrase/acetyltransferase-like protein (isoleucine patch superfamily)